MLLSARHRRRREGECLFCFKKVEDDSTIRRCTESLYNSCFKHLPEALIGKSQTYEEFAKNNGPFCAVCLQAAENLSQKNELLTTVENEINNFVFSLTSSILENRSSPVNKPFQYESNIIIVIQQKEEPSSSIEFDFFDCYEDGDCAVEIKGQQRNSVTGDQKSKISSPVKPKMTNIIMQKRSDGKMIATLPCECGMSFENIELLKEHATSCATNKMDTSNAEIRFRCGVCGFQAQTIEQLGIHKMQHTKSYPCNKCSEKFHTKLYLKKHIALVHQRVLHKATKSRTHFKEEIMLPEDDVDTGITDNVMPSEEVQDEQIKYTTEDNEKRECELREKVTIPKTENELIILKESIKKPFACKICDKKYNLRRFLDYHVRTHIKLERHLCVQLEKYLCTKQGCGQSFPHLSHLSKHIQLEHS